MQKFSESDARATIVNSLFETEGTQETAAKEQALDLLQQTQTLTAMSQKIR